MHNEQAMGYRRKACRIISWAVGRVGIGFEQDTLKTKRFENNNNNKINKLALCLSLVSVCLSDLSDQATAGRRIGHIEMSSHCTNTAAPRTAASGVVYRTAG